MYSAQYLWLIGISLCSLAITEGQNFGIENVSNYIKLFGKANEKKSKAFPGTKEFIDPKKGVYEKSLCHDDVCCDFKIKMDFNKSAATPENEYYRYYACALNISIPSTNQQTVVLKLCGVTACPDDNLENCEESNEGLQPMIFQTAEIKMLANVNESFPFYPVTKGSDLEPLNNTNFCFGLNKENKDKTQYEMRLTNYGTELLAFGILGANWITDPNGGQNSSYNSCPNNSNGGQNGSNSVTIFSVTAILIISVVGRYII